MGKTLGWVGIALFAVSWFVPVVEGQDFFNGDEKPPGWQACHVSSEILTAGESPLDDPIKSLKERLLLGLPSLTNALMVVGLFMLLFAGRSRHPLLGTLLLASPALNLSWFYLEANQPGGLAAGYWIWVGSFVLAGFGLLSKKSASQ